MCLTKAEQLKQNMFFQLLLFLDPSSYYKQNTQCLLVLSATARGLHRAVDVSQVVEVVVQAGIRNNFLASFYKTALHLVRRGGRSQPSPLLGLDGSDLGAKFQGKRSENITGEVWQELPAGGWRGWWPERRETTWPGYEECFIF